MTDAHVLIAVEDLRDALVYASIAAAVLAVAFWHLVGHLIALCRELWEA